MSDFIVCDICNRYILCDIESTIYFKCPYCDNVLIDIDILDEDFFIMNQNDLCLKCKRYCDCMFVQKLWRFKMTIDKLFQMCYSIARQKGSSFL